MGGEAVPGSSKALGLPWAPRPNPGPGWATTNSRECGASACQQDRTTAEPTAGGYKEERRPQASWAPPWRHAARLGASAATEALRPDDPKAQSHPARACALPCPRHPHPSFWFGPAPGWEVGRRMLGNSPPSGEIPGRVLGARSQLKGPTPSLAKPPAFGSPGAWG